jgi:cell division protein FtsW
MNKSNLIFITSLLLIIGLLFISLSSISEAAYTAGDKFYFIKKQLIWSGIGIIAFIVAAKIKFSFLKKYTQVFFILSLGLLLLVLLPRFGNLTLGARRWFDFGFIGIQPSEIFKLTAIIFFTKMFADNNSRNIKNLLIYLGIPLFLIILEPNLSTAILIAATIITTYYLSGGEITSLFTLCLFAVAISLILILTSPYRRERFNALVNPQNSSSYHSDQIILALTAGHWTGKGLANSDQKYRFLPKVSTDSILAVIGEETGFLGCSLIVILYLLLILQIIKIGNQTTDVFNSLLVTSVASWIAYQSLINISAIVALIPLTGIPLPLISYGGSSLVTLMFALGLVQNIQQQSTLVYSDKREKLQIHHHRRHPPHSSH